LEIEGRGRVMAMEEVREEVRMGRERGCQICDVA
jgi:hypothetical protein